MQIDSLGHVSASLNGKHPYKGFLHATANTAPAGGSVPSLGAPAVVQRSNGETDVVVEGPNNSLMYYYNAFGSPNWGSLLVGGNGSTY